MRLIDADAALERFQGLTELVVGEGAALVKALIFAGLKSRSITPTAVVLCKDCIHRPTVAGDKVIWTGFDLDFPDGKCPCQCEEDGFYSWMPPDAWFCPMGDRKGEKDG